MNTQSNNRVYVNRFGRRTTTSWIAMAVACSPTTSAFLCSSSFLSCTMQESPITMMATSSAKSPFRKAASLKRKMGLISSKRESPSGSGIKRIITIDEIETLFDGMLSDAIAPQQTPSSHDIINDVVHLDDHFETTTTTPRHKPSPPRYPRRHGYPDITELTLGSSIDGEVTGYSKYGIFVRIPYNVKSASGMALLHKSQIPPKKRSDFRSAYPLGSTIHDARVSTINYETAQVGLSVLSPSPTLKSLTDFQVGDVISKATVTSVVGWGLFVDVGCSTCEALVHKLRISKQGKPPSVGDVIQVRIIRRNDKTSELEASMLTIEQDLQVDHKKRKGEITQWTAEETSLYGSIYQDLEKALKF